MVTLQWASVEHGKNCRAVEGRVGFTHSDARRNRRAGAPKRANHALPSSPSSLFSTCPIRGSKMFFVCFVYFVVQNCVSCVSCFSWFPSSHLRRRAAESPCGRSTEAHCKVTTHYFLLSPPYSLLNHNYGFVIGFRVDIEGRDLSVLPGCIHREASPCPEAVELSILPGLWECRQQMYDTCV